MKKIDELLGGRKNFDELWVAKNSTNFWGWREKCQRVSRGNLSDFDQLLWFGEKKFHRFFFGGDKRLNLDLNFRMFITVGLGARINHQLFKFYII